MTKVNEAVNQLNEKSNINLLVAQGKGILPRLRMANKQEKEAAQTRQRNLARQGQSFEQSGQPKEHN